jgi:hypothetical protein
MGHLEYHDRCPLVRPLLRASQFSAHLSQSPNINRRRHHLYSHRLPSTQQVSTQDPDGCRRAYRDGWDDLVDLWQRCVLLADCAFRC